MVGVIIVHQAYMEKAKTNLSKNSVTTLEKSPTKQGRFTQSLHTGQLPSSGMESNNISNDGVTNTKQKYLGCCLWLH